MDPTVTIRSYEPGDENGIIMLLESVFQGWPHFNISCSSLDYWRWKYLDHPFDEKYLVVATVDEKIVGSNFGMVYRGYLFGKPILCYQGYDLAVNPDYRRLGLWTRMTDLKHKLREKLDVKLVITVTVNPIVYNEQIKKEGRFPFPQKVNTMLRLNDVDLHFKMRGMENETLKKIGVKILKGVNRLTSSPLSGTRDYGLHEVSSFDDAYSGFWETARESYDFILDRSVEFMNWRYLDPRAGDFKVISAKKGSEWLGYVVYNFNRWNKDYPETCIADLLTLPGRSDVASDLIDEVGRRSDAEGVNAVYSWAIENNMYSGCFEKLGYINSRSIPYIIYNSNDLGEDKDAFRNIKPDKILFNYGDCDWI